MMNRSARSSRGARPFPGVLLLAVVFGLLCGCESWFGPAEGDAEQSQTGPTGGSEEVADAEYEVIDDDKQSKTG